MPVLYQAPERQNSGETKVKKSGAKTVADIFPQGGVFSAFVVRPKVRFQAQEPGEEVVLLLRRHWITNLPWFLEAILMILGPLALKFISPFTFLPLRFQLVAVIIWYLLVIGFVFEKFLSWYFNVYIVTNKRVVDLDFYNIIYYNQAQADLNQITDMNITVSGVVRLLFNFGDLVIETAAEAPNLEFSAVPNPRKVMEIIEQLKS